MIADSDALSEPLEETLLSAQFVDLLNTSESGEHDSPVEPFGKKSFRYLQYVFAILYILNRKSEIFLFTLC